MRTGSLSNASRAKRGYAPDKRILEVKVPGSLVEGMEKLSRYIRRATGNGLSRQLLITACILNFSWEEVERGV